MRAPVAAVQPPLDRSGDPEPPGGGRHRPPPPGAPGPGRAPPRVPDARGPRCQHGAVADPRDTDRTPVTGTREVTAGIGAGAVGLGPPGPDGLATADMVLNIGPQHPSTHGVLRLRLVVDGERVVSAEPVDRLHAPRRGEAVRGPRLPPDPGARQPPRLAVRLRQRARRVPRGRADDGAGGAGAGGLAAHPAGRAEPGPQPPDVPGLVPDRARRDHADLLRLPGARGDPGGDGGGLRRPDALHVQPGRRAARRGPGRLDRPGRGDGRDGPRPGSARSRTCCSATRSSSPGPAASACSSPEAVRPTGCPGRSPAPPASTSTCAATSPTSPTASCFGSAARPVVTGTAGDCLARFVCLVEQVEVVPRPGRCMP